MSQKRNNQEFNQTVVELFCSGTPVSQLSLNKDGYTGNVNRVQRLMKQAGIKSCIIKKFRPTQTQEPVEERENVLNQDFTTTTINGK